VGLFYCLLLDVWYFMIQSQMEYNVVQPSPNYKDQRCDRGLSQLEISCLFSCHSRNVPLTGRQPPPLSSVLYGIIYKRRSYWPHKYSSEKNQVPRELALIALSLACM